MSSHHWSRNQKRDKSLHKRNCKTNGNIKRLWKDRKNEERTGKISEQERQEMVYRMIEIMIRIMTRQIPRTVTELLNKMDRIMQEKKTESKKQDG